MFITGGPLVALVVEGPRAVEAVRTIMGVTDPVQATPGSLRGDYALEIGQNLVHGSDSPESAAREIALFFPTILSLVTHLRRDLCHRRQATGVTMHRGSGGSTGHAALVVACPPPTADSCTRKASPAMANP